MKRVIIVFAFLMWGATLCVWYVIHQEKNRYIATNGFVLDIEQQRYIKVGKRHWDHLWDTADEQHDRFGEVVFTDKEYRYLVATLPLINCAWGNVERLIEDGISSEKIIGLVEERKAYADIVHAGIPMDRVREWEVVVNNNVVAWGDIAEMILRGETISKVDGYVKEMRPAKYDIQDGRRLSLEEIFGVDDKKLSL